MTSRILALWNSSGLSNPCSDDARAAMISGSRTIYINRAPVLTLWAGVVAERLGFRRDEALTLGRAVAGLNAYSKGVSLGLFRPSPKSVKDRRKRLTRRSPKKSIRKRAGLKPQLP